MRFCWTWTCLVHDTAPFVFGFWHKSPWYFVPQHSCGDYLDEWKYSDTLIFLVTFICIFFYGTCRNSSLKLLLMQLHPVCNYLILFGSCLQAHGTFVCGKNGGGVAEAFDCEVDVDICVGTLSKAAGCQGGFIACRYHLKEVVFSFFPGIFLFQHFKSKKYCQHDSFYSSYYASYAWISL